MRPAQPSPAQHSIPSMQKIEVFQSCLLSKTLVNFVRLLSNINGEQVRNVNEQTMEVEQILASDQPKRSNSKLRHCLWAAGGFLFFVLGMVGVVLPILPTSPFILVAAFCFARSSERLNSWFKSTKLYKQVLEGYVTKRSMTLKAKLTISCLSQHCWPSASLSWGTFPSVASCSQSYGLATSSTSASSSKPTKRSLIFPRFCRR